jgi:hypothetical protein
VTCLLCWHGMSLLFYYLMNTSPLKSFLLCFSFCVVLLAACAAPVATATLTPAATDTQAPTFTTAPSPTLTPTPVRTPPALPDLFRASQLNPLDSPHSYIPDACQVLKDRWSSANSAPGTVVMAIMFHSITSKPVTSSDQISETNFRRLMDALHEKGFQAITTAQLLGFLETNAAIPARAVLLVVDDRRTYTYYDTWFRQYWQDWGWPVVNAWISTDLSTTDLWQQQVNLQNEGWVDYQAHGYQHMPSIGPDSTDAYILQELQKPIQAFQAHFNKKPLAIIWPGGSFTPHAAGIARQLGYRLGFTTNPRGPVMFDWVPLADEEDPLRPSWLPEGAVNDPLMVLPRYWDTDAILHLDQVIQVGQDAGAYAEKNKAVELQYYDIVCSSKYGPIP